MRFDYPRLGKRSRSWLGHPPSFHVVFRYPDPDRARINRFSPDARRRYVQGPPYRSWVTRVRLATSCSGRTTWCRIRLPAAKVRSGWFADCRLTGGSVRTADIRYQAGTGRDRRGRYGVSDGDKQTFALGHCRRQPPSPWLTFTTGQPPLGPTGTSVEAATIARARLHHLSGARATEMRNVTN
jgi:hypothetical protein